ncbi:d9c75fbc-0954-4900-bdb6-f6a08336c71d [Sclerotinia trifoliorum]|uniref:D9c75fbc-0954-4900-bdb6-f6a08336c71d n=1 Tax=Sclerotinia trifoliorum TaxID=28548 RepID=A0A8H2ZP54_9HELO|nr:d9c75fbc-0954-4900-bdb6-f6a08336c71d [Sclerotinia trifoliorum]
MNHNRRRKGPGIKTSSGDDYSTSLVSLPVILVPDMRKRGEIMLMIIAPILSSMASLGVARCRQISGYKWMMQLALKEDMILR